MSCIRKSSLTVLILLLTAGVALRGQHLSLKKSAKNIPPIDSLMQSAIKDSIFPGGVLLFGTQDGVIYQKAYGHYHYLESSPKMEVKTLFDLASVSKVVGTTSAAMLLYDEGRLELDKPVKDYLPEFDNNGKDKITVRNLLLHNSGLPAFRQFYRHCKSSKEVIDEIMKIKTEFAAGTEYLYSDLGMITLQLIIEKITGTTLEKFLEGRLFKPLRMDMTMYSPPVSMRNQCAPTEIDTYWRMKQLQGQVHDEAAYLLGGVAGHAGLFSTAGNLANFCQMFLNGGKFKGKNIINEKTISTWTCRQSAQSSRALGWDTRDEKSSAGVGFSISAFGHTGFTGTSIWIDPVKKVFTILLSNRVNPTRERNGLMGFRPLIHNAVMKYLEKK